MRVVEKMGVAKELRVKWGCTIEGVASKMGIRELGKNTQILDPWAQEHAVTEADDLVKHIRGADESVFYLFSFQKLPCTTPPLTLNLIYILSSSCAARTLVLGDDKKKGDKGGKRSRSSWRRARRRGKIGEFRLNSIAIQCILEANRSTGTV
ncbi:hypothetical protein NE237_019970 [Protea cynaroides]|uniref:Uncharacterized protein n=1 Tax=Protea cynaroides TaxID=273540 RepID=A0A9Q0H6C0_9MAGN|nr:hypothetical protein NE237_019970 [Protea cynaroides]